MTSDLRNSRCSWSNGLRPEKFYASVAVPLAPVRVPIRDHLPREPCHFHLSVNDKGDNETIPENVYRSSGIYLKVPKE